MSYALETRRLRARYQQGRPSSETLDSFLVSSWLLVVATNPWHSSAYRCPTPASAPTLTWRSPSVSLILCSNLPLIMKEAIHVGLGACSILVGPRLTYLVRAAMTLLPKKATF